MDIQSLAKDIHSQGEQSLEGIDFITNGEQYLTFRLGDEQFAIDILCVEEIRSWERPTRIPNAPNHVKGVINMRGVIVPIIDLRTKFGVGQSTYSEVTVVIVLTINGENGAKTIGFVVDAVSDVLNAEDNQIKESPAFGGSISPEFIAGLINVDENVVTLLNADALYKIEKHQFNGGSKQ
ncbi:MAG: chemotaxis protein CheW [Thalassotalea sp.]